MTKNPIYCAIDTSCIDDADRIINEIAPYILKKIDIKLRLRQMSEDIDEIIEYINKEENNLENVGPSEIKILIEGVRAVMDLVIAIKNK